MTRAAGVWRCDAGLRFRHYALTSGIVVYGVWNNNNIDYTANPFALIKYKKKN